MGKAKKAREPLLLEPGARYEARVVCHIRDVEGTTVQGHPADASSPKASALLMAKSATQDRMRKRPQVQGLGSSIGDPEVDAGGIHQGSGSLRNFAEDFFDVQRGEDINCVRRVNVRRRAKRASRAS